MFAWDAPITHPAREYWPPMSPVSWSKGRVIGLLLQYSWWRHQMEHFPRYWPFVWGIHRSRVNFPHKGEWCGALIFSLICTRINGWVNNDKAGDLRRHHAHYAVIVMFRAFIASWLYDLNNGMVWLYVLLKSCNIGCTSMDSCKKDVTPVH